MEIKIKMVYKGGEIKVSVGKGKYRIDGICIPTKGGLIITIVGGEIPHVGSVAIAIPRPSLKDPQKLSVTSSIFTMLGHKDDEIAKPVSERVARELNQFTVVITGMHIDEASEEEIERLIVNSNRVVDKLIIKLKSRVQI